MASGLDVERLRRLIDVGGLIVAELDLDGVLGRVLEAARELTGARYAALGVLDQDRRALERFITRGIDEAGERAIGARPSGRGVLGLLIDDPRPLRLDSVGEHAASYGFPGGHPPMRTFLGVPVLIRGLAWGNLYLTEKQGDAVFDEADEEAAVVLSRWAAIAVENAGLYRDVAERRTDLERAVRNLEATQSVALAVGAETRLDRVLELIVKRARALVEARSVVILLREGEHLVVAAGAGDGRRLEDARIPVRESTSGEVMERGYPERIADVSARLRVGAEQLGVDGARTALVVPLAYRGAPLGVLIAFDRGPDGRVFTAEDEQMLVAFAASGATAVATARSVQQQRLADALKAADAERRRWARELHDETLQALGGLRVLLAASRRTGDPAALARSADQAIEQIEQEITNLGAIISELRPAALDELGLLPAVEALLERHRAVNGLEIAAELDLPAGKAAIGELGPETQATVYRVVQEALMNVAKHARADRVAVSVRLQGGRVFAEVSDDGRGFAVAQAAGRGFGLTGMRERALMAGGELRIDSSERGTTVALVLPIAPQGAAQADISQSPPSSAVTRPRESA